MNPSLSLALLVLASPAVAGSDPRQHPTPAPQAAPEVVDLFRAGRAAPPSAAVAPCPSAGVPVACQDPREEDADEPAEWEDLDELDFGGGELDFDDGLDFGGGELDLDDEGLVAWGFAGQDPDPMHEHQERLQEMREALEEHARALEESRRAFEEQQREWAETMREHQRALRDAERRLTTEARERRAADRRAEREHERSAGRARGPGLAMTIPGHPSAPAPAPAGEPDCATPCAPECETAPCTPCPPEAPSDPFALRFDRDAIAKLAKDARRLARSNGLVELGELGAAGKKLARNWSLPENLGIDAEALQRSVHEHLARAHELAQGAGAYVYADGELRSLGSADGQGRALALDADALRRYAEIARRGAATHAVAPAASDDTVQELTDLIREMSAEVRGLRDDLRGLRDDLRGDGDADGER